MSEHILSPVVLEAFLRIYYSPSCPSGLDTPAVTKGLALLENNGVIQREKADENGWSFAITPKGHVFLNMILSTPFPVTKAVDPQTEQ